jgi:UDP-glucose 4-epimerase
MAVLVTGGAGYIGSHMVLALVDAGHEEVVVLDDLSTGYDWVLPPEVRLVVGDVADQALVTETILRHQIDTVAHFAAKIVVPESVADPLGYYLANTVKTRALMETAVRTNVRHFIFSSTAAVYGEPEIVPVPETLTPNPINPYGRSKLMSEWMLADAAAAHGRSGQSMPAATHLIKVATQAALGQRTHLEVFGTDYPTRDGSCLRDYIQVSDLAAAHLTVLDYLRGGGDSLTVNCGYGRGYSVLEVVEVVKRISGRDFEVRLSPRRPGDPAQIIAGADRIRNELGWTPKYDDLDVIVAQALAWEDTLAKRNRR